MKGKTIKIVADDGSIYATKTDDIQTDAEVREVASLGSALWKTYKAGRKGWSFSVSFLVGENKAKTDLLKVGKSVVITIMEAGLPVLTGTAIITACHITASVGSLVQGSFSFRGTGELTIYS